MSIRGRPPETESEYMWALQRASWVATVVLRSQRSVEHASQHVQPDSTSLFLTDQHLFSLTPPKANSPA